MTPSPAKLCTLALLAIITLARAAIAQEPPFAAARPDDAVEAYMERLGLNRLLAEQLADRLSTADADSKLHLAERLGKMYVQLLSAAETTESRTLWEKRGRELLAAVPEADTGELRLSLNKALYVRIEEIAERGRLRLADEAELREADRQLRSLETEFTEIARKANARVDERERAEVAGNNTEALDAALAESRRIRSLAYYYAGWCHYYVAMLNRSESEAVEAMKCFGWLLNSSGGRLASVDRLPADLLRYDHIARAAIGSALAASLRGNDVEAIRWLDAIADADEVPKAILDQLLIRRIIVLGEAKRWADLEQLIRRARRGEKLHGYGGGPNTHEPEPLAVNAARLLAVITLEADKRIAAAQIEALARTALGDLVARQEIAQVLDMVRRYGTSPIGDAGFIVHYVRGLLQYDLARVAHKQQDDSGDEPTTDSEIANLYSAAATMLQAAVRQPDAESFRSERTKASIMLGRCSFYRGDLSDAGEKFLAAWESGGRAEGGEHAEEALWLAVLAFDSASKAGGAQSTAAERRAQVSTLFLASYPDSQRAARIVLLQVAAGATVGDDDALRILSEVPKSSPVYDTARRRVAQLLYTRYRAAKGSDRDLAAMRFMSAAEELLVADRNAAMEGPRTEAAAACERLVTRVRQMLDALLGGSSPDAIRAVAVLDVLKGVATFNNLDLKAHEPELTFRRLQIALARNEDSEAIAMSEQLNALGTPAAHFASAADRLIYKRLANRWKLSAEAGAMNGLPISPDDLAMLVRFGRRVVDRIDRDALPPQDPAVLSLRATLAAAATLLADRGDADLRELAITLDEAVLKAAPRSEESLRRLAYNAEAASRLDLAIECWRVLFNGAAPESPEWFEARYQSLRLLRTSDPIKTRELLDQHRNLYPQFGPEPWGDKLRLLDSELTPPGSPPPPPAPLQPSPPGTPASAPPSTPPAGGGGA